MLRVGVDAWNLPGDRRGVGRYVREVLRSWCGDFSNCVQPVLIVPEWHTWTVTGRYRREIDNEPLPLVSRASHRRAKLDVLWFPFNGCSWSGFELPAVATLHDATPFVFPDAYGSVRDIMHVAATRCALLLTDSHFSREALVRELGVEAARVRTVLLGAGAPAPEDGAARLPYVLFVGTTDARKGIDVLIAAMQIVARRYPELSLVLAGAQSDAVPAADGVRIDARGFVDDAELERLYRQASVFAFPSRYEGFGLPVLEAMRYGTPVVASDASSIPEVAGDAALLVPVDDAQALAAQIVAAHGDAALRARLAQRGYQRVRDLSWTACAGATLDALESVVR